MAEGDTIRPGFREYQFGVGAQMCANGETYEFFLTLDGKRAFPGGVGVFRAVHTGESLVTHAWLALKELMAK